MDVVERARRFAAPGDPASLDDPSPDAFDIALGRVGARLDLLDGESTS